MKYLILVVLLWNSMPAYSVDVIPHDRLVVPSLELVEIPQKPIKKKSKKQQREKRRFLKQKKKKKQQQEQLNNTAWNGFLTLGIIGLCLLLGLPLLIAFLVSTSFSFSLPAILFILLLIPLAIVYLTLAIAIAIILSVGIDKLQKRSTPESSTASIIAIMSAVYLVLIAIVCLFFSPAGLVLLYLQFLLMLPGIVGLVLGLMKIKRGIKGKDVEEKNSALFR